ncbi:MAG TPA: dTDP-4-dehydrorhamnose 3,5-epimerase [Sedimentisphaerales bacterium]|nr:dTDP-4-dehydrorhamnose 3,5-epimerase [Sedimentisphaerales bacterium]HRS10163.1 dTDP-4-dehydrorhamnose 3,5-epimerase [Sedimentisphaerales bacterium]HRV46869.1 dTDP-4-dehydrorhamnose 3,5-epimerase [Sedimentisphaerales bacterium]
MQVSRTQIEGLLLIQPDVYRDQRGYFFEQYRRDRYEQIGLPAEFVQDNCSCSRQGTVRGLHYQIGASAQGKLTTVLYGRVLDVAVDVRFGSPTFGEHVAVELSNENCLQFWIPPGFAHGFSVLSEVAVFSYKCTSLYSKEDERSVLFSDPDLGIDWKVTNPIVSAKDLAAPRLRSIERDYVYSR